MIFSYVSKPNGAKCWVDSDLNGATEAGRETELAYEGLYLPYANTNFKGIASRIELAAPADYAVICNGKLISEHSSDGYTYSTYISDIETSPTIIGGHFEKCIGTNKNFVFYHQEGFENTAMWCLDESINIFHKISELLKSDLQPFLQLVQLKRTEFGQYAAVPMVLFPIQDIDRDMSDKKKKEFVNMMCHEIAHFWFGWVLTPVSTDEQWISEGFAQFFNIYLDGVFYGDESRKKTILRYVEETNNIPLAEQCCLASYPLEAPHQFDLVRIKSALAIESLRQLVGEQCFIHLLQQLLITYANQCVSTENIKDLCITLFPDYDMDGFFNKHFFSVNNYVLHDGILSTEKL
jgi:hypothetical protein